MELYHGIIFMERIPGMPGTSPEPPGSRGSPGHGPGTPRDAPGTPGHAPGTPGDAPGTPGHAPGTHGDVPETPWGRPWDPRGPPGTPYGPLKDHPKGHISENRQRQKLSIAVFEPACQGPSHAALDQAGCFIKGHQNQKDTPPALGYPRAGYG